MTENQKARTKYGAQSPFTPLLQEDKEKEYADMEREEEQEEEFVPTCPPPMDIPSAKVATEAVTMDGIVTLLQQQLGPITANINALNAGVQLLDAKYRNLRSALENWPKDMETRMDVTQAQVDKMDELLQHLREENSKVEDLIKIRWKPLCETWSQAWGHKTRRKMLTKHPWQPVHGNSEVKFLLEKSKALIARTKAGMKGSSKSRPNAHH